MLHFISSPSEVESFFILLELKYFFPLCYTSSFLIFHSLTHFSAQVRLERWGRGEKNKMSQYISVKLLKAHRNHNALSKQHETGCDEAASL